MLLGRACRETSLHSSPHSANNRLVALQVTVLPEESPHACEVVFLFLLAQFEQLDKKENEIQGPSVVFFQFFNQTTVFKFRIINETHQFLGVQL